MYLTTILKRKKKEASLGVYLGGVDEIKSSISTIWNEEVKGPDTLGSPSDCILRESFYTFSPKEVTSTARLSSSVAVHTERFIVGGCLVVFFKAERTLGAIANYKADTSHHPQPTGLGRVWN